MEMGAYLGFCNFGGYLGEGRGALIKRRAVGLRR